MECRRPRSIEKYRNRSVLMHCFPFHEGGTFYSGRLGIFVEKACALYGGYYERNVDKFGILRGGIDPDLL